jgi:hypothetical protein
LDCRRIGGLLSSGDTDFRCRHENGYVQRCGTGCREEAVESRFESLVISF